MSIKNKFFFFAVFSVILLFSERLFSQEKPERGEFFSDNSEYGYMYNSGDKRDPFIPLVSPDGRVLEPAENKKNLGEPHLEGIIYDVQGSSYAIIDGEIMQAGDRFGEYDVLEIQQQKVKFVRQGKEFEVELKKED